MEMEAAFVAGRAPWGVVTWEHNIIKGCLRDRAHWLEVREMCSVILLIWGFEDLPVLVLRLLGLFCIFVNKKAALANSIQLPSRVFTWGMGSGRELVISESTLRL